MSILVAESNEHVRDVLAVILEAEGYEVTLASTWREALQTLRRRTDIDLVLADAMMPILSTWSFEGPVTLGWRRPNVPVVMMTGGLGDPPSRGTPVLRKPFDMHQLLDMVRAQLATRSRRASVRPRRVDAGLAGRPPDPDVPASDRAVLSDSNV
jgi:DNA-binding response OmpR family regulator